ncbi:unnamed protein product [Pieris macdunnoughi]|uniref:C-type lectin domain-containing protein n=1 Tax=Pieris macdunnoughi TaxID=345717 RepID=A0A821V4A5_9NEOP|nr:unnamed protein product [Pieris macdunnoughi]
MGTKLFVAFFLVFNIYECSQYRYDYKFVTEVDGWIKLHQVPATWDEARLRCQLEGAILCSPNTINLVEVMKFVMQNTRAGVSGVFTGTHATFSKGDFHSVDGVPLGKMPVEWMPMEPDNENNSESCIVMLRNGTIADINCDEVFPYICYRKSSKREYLTECGTVDTGYKLDRRTGSCYKFHTDERNWTRAFMTCAAEGGHLAIINSDEEAKVMRDLFKVHAAGSIRYDTVLMGFHDWRERGVWTTIHGQSLQEAGYDMFEPGQPDSAAPGEYCGGMFRAATLNDVWCHKSLSFICEKTVDSLLDWSDNY